MNRFLPVALLLLVATLTLAQVPATQIKPEHTPATLASAEKPVRVYMLQEPTSKNWYRLTALGTVEWSEQSTAEVWTSKKQVLDAKSQMLGQRAKGTVVRAFLLLAVDDR
jgi:hypothetical protein